ncbi:MAG: DUF2235 domain-containing protein [Aestuariivirga sp.]
MILLDGTWNQGSGETIPTNIVHLRDLILRETGPKRNPITQQIHYDAGIGTDGSWLKRRLDGLTGGGLEETVRSAYRYLCLHFEKGLEIYVFGYSRGAFSARSLVGYIHAAGLLTPENCDQDTEERAWRFYRTPKRRRFPAEKKELEKLCQPKDQVRIACLGVFDTVGARGIPFNLLRPLNARKYGFHDTNLSSIVDFAFQALALDEHRWPFGATLWSKAFHIKNERVEQVWFPGVHADVGGGGQEDRRLSNIPLYWMVKRIQDCGLGLKFDEKRLAKVAEKRDATAPSYGNPGLLGALSWLWPRLRIVSQTRTKLSHNLSSLPRYAEPLFEALHWSVFERIKAPCWYAPDNIDKDIYATIYVKDTKFDTDTVGHDERFLEWWANEKDYWSMLSILPDERLRREFEEKAKTQLEFCRPKRRSISRTKSKKVPPP